MSFYYYINPAFNALTAVDQVQSYFPHWTSLYQKSSEFSNSPYLAWTIPQTEKVVQNETFYTTSSPIAVEEVHNLSSNSDRAPPKKRRIEKTLEKEIVSAKKNSESNLINQFYSFFGSKEKSEKTVEKCCALLGKNKSQTEKILPFFYTVIRYINVKRGRKYVNAAMLLKFFTPEEFETYLPEIKNKLEECPSVSLAELCQIFRRCTKYFLKNVSVGAILTSKRISIVSKEEHLKKRRRILRAVLQS